MKRLRSTKTLLDGNRRGPDATQRLKITNWTVFAQNAGWHVTELGCVGGTTFGLLLQKTDPRVIREIEIHFPRQGYTAAECVTTEVTRDGMALNEWVLREV